MPTERSKLRSSRRQPGFPISYEAAIEEMRGYGLPRRRTSSVHIAQPAIRRICAGRELDLASCEQGGRDVADGERPWGPERGAYGALGTDGHDRRGRRWWSRNLPEKFK